ncbi:energy-coupling factor transporter transmembrane component T [Brassicibacter mesophilus]|uniref:energy-coupling factor transporter transmembrane component T n=1 Tax=Brassicibacter mesophilus TaxID=745119 RepID=UPI003D1AADA3
MKNLHPFTVLFHTITLLLMVLVYNHPLYIVSMLVYLILIFMLSGNKDKLLQILKYSLYMFVLILIINPLASSHGMTIIYKSCRLPVIGKIKITLEAIFFGVNMGLKLIIIMLIFKIYDVFIDRDIVFNLFLKYFNRLAITISMTINIIHRLKLDILRVKDVMILRGANLKQKNIFNKIKVHYPILKTILISSLEGSLDRAEALYSKGYGKKIKRSNYYKIDIKWFDSILNVSTLIIIIAFSHSLISQNAIYRYYPIVQSVDFLDISLLFLCGSFIIYAALIWWWKNENI